MELGTFGRYLTYVYCTKKGTQRKGHSFDRKCLSDWKIRRWNGAADGVPQLASRNEVREESEGLAWRAAVSAEADRHFFVPRPASLDMNRRDSRAFHSVEF